MHTETNIILKKIEQLLQKSAELEAEEFLINLRKIDEYCSEVISKDCEALQNIRFKAYIIEKSKLFDKKYEALDNQLKSISENNKTLLETGGEINSVRKKSQQYQEQWRKDFELLKKFKEYENNDNRTFINIEKAIEDEKELNLQIGGKEDAFYASYRIKDYQSGKYILHINYVDYKNMSLQELQNELSEAKEELEELEEEFEELEDLDEEDYGDYDFESKEDYLKRLEELNDDIWIQQSNIELIIKHIKEKHNKKEV